MAAPTIRHLKHGFTYRTLGGSDIDQGRDAEVIDSDNDLAYLDVSLDWGGPHEALGIRTGSGIALSNELNPGSIISVGSIPIGEIDDGSGPLLLLFKFYDAATPALVQELVRALTYTSSDVTAADEFRGLGLIHLLLWDKARESDWSSISIADRISGSQDANVFTATSDVINSGDELDGGAGNDVLELTGGGRFDLHLMGLISGVETIRGSQANDFIIITGTHLSSVQKIEGGEETFDDILTITGTAIDLSGTVVEGFEKIALTDDGAKVTLGHAATAKLISGYDSKDDTVILTGGTLTALERLSLHRQGIDTIVAKDASGRDVSTTHKAPKIASFNGAIVEAPIGKTVFLDAGQDADLTVDSGILKSLYVRTSEVSDPTERLGVHTGGGVRVVHTDLYVDDVHIGRLYTIPNSLSFSFNEDATTQAATGSTEAPETTGSPAAGARMRSSSRAPSARRRTWIPSPTSGRRTTRSSSRTGSSKR
jgi:hypothetical protein